MSVHHRKIKTITLSITPESGTPVNVECQVRTWTLTPPQEDGERFYTQCPDGEFLEDANPVWTLELGFFSDWTAGGVSDFLMSNAGAVADFVLDHHPDVVEEHVTWTGKLKVKAPPVGGDARATEQQTVTFACIGEPQYARGGV